MLRVHQERQADGNLWRYVTNLEVNPSTALSSQLRTFSVKLRVHCKQKLCFWNVADRTSEIRLEKVHFPDILKQSRVFLFNRTTASKLGRNSVANDSAHQWDMITQVLFLQRKLALRFVNGAQRNLPKGVWRLQELQHRTNGGHLREVGTVRTSPFFTSLKISAPRKDLSFNFHCILNGVSSNSCKIASSHKKLVPCKHRFNTYLLWPSSRRDPNSKTATDTKRI